MDKSEKTGTGINKFVDHVVKDMFNNIIVEKGFIDFATENVYLIISLEILIQIILCTFFWFDSKKQSNKNCLLRKEYEITEEIDQINDEIENEN